MSRQARKESTAKKREAYRFEHASSSDVDIGNIVEALLGEGDDALEVSPDGDVAFEEGDVGS